MKWLSDHRMAALGFVVSAAYWPGLLEGAFVPRWAAIAVGVPLVSKLDPRALSEVSRIVLGFLLFICALSLLRSPLIEAGEGDMIFVLILSLAFVAGAALTSMDDLMLGIGVGLAFSSVLAVTQYTGIWSPIPQGSADPSGLFFNSEMLGEFSALVAVWAIVRAVNGGGLKPALIAAVVAVPLALSHSRIGVAAVAIGLLYTWRPRLRVMIPVVAIGVTVAVYALLYGGSISSSLHRIILWGATVMAFTPLGHGLGWVSLAYPYEEFSHSDALQAIAEVGIGGLALIFIPIAAFRGNRGNHAERALFAAVLFEVAVSFPLHFPASGFLAATVAGFLLGVGPALRDRASQCDLPHEPRRFRWRHGSSADALGGEYGGRGLSVRSVSAEPSALCTGPIGKGWI